VLGSRVYSSADNGTLTTVSLNAAGLAYLQARAGGEVALGGRLTSDRLFGLDAEAIFAFSGAPTDVRQLVIEFTPAQAVPAPPAVVLAGAGALSAGVYGWRRRRAASA